jgi:hypothetical protein
MKERVDHMESSCKNNCSSALLPVFMSSSHAMLAHAKCCADEFSITAFDVRHGMPRSVTIASCTLTAVSYGMALVLTYDLFTVFT